MQRGNSNPLAETPSRCRPVARCVGRLSAVLVARVCLQMTAGGEARRPGDLPSQPDASHRSAYASLHFTKFQGNRCCTPTTAGGEAPRPGDLPNSTRSNLSTRVGAAAAATLVHGCCTMLLADDGGGRSAATRRLAIAPPDASHRSVSHRESAGIAIGERPPTRAHITVLLFWLTFEGLA